LEDLGRKIRVEKNKKKRKNEKDLKFKKMMKKMGKKESKTPCQKKLLKIFFGYENINLKII